MSFDLFWASILLNNTANWTKKKFLKNFSGNQNDRKQKQKPKSSIFV